MKKVIALALSAVLVKVLQLEPVRKPDPINELVKVLRENNRPVFWTPIRLVLVSSLVTIGSVYLVVNETQKKYDEQEKVVVLKLLEAAESELEVIIEDIDRIGKAQINTDDSNGSVIRFGSDPNDTLPYPTIFTDVITDKRVILHLSKTNLLTFYSSGKKLDKYSYAIMHMNSDNLLEEARYAKYRDELKFLQLALSKEIKSQEGKLSEEIDYQKDELSEQQVVKANEGFRFEARRDSPFKYCFDLKNGVGSGCLSEQ